MVTPTSPGVLVRVDAWHKGSRYWRFGMYVVLLSVALSLYFDGPAAFLAVAPVFLTGAGAKSTVGEYNRPQFKPYPEGKDD